MGYSKVKLLLVSMPNHTLLLNWAGYLVPNLGIASIAGNVDKKICEPRILDLVIKPKGAKKTIIDILKEFNPNLVGLTAMSFQFDTAIKIAQLIKSFNPDIKIMVGGYHASLNYQEISESVETQYIDFMIRGEGEETVSELIRALYEGADDFQFIKGLSYKKNTQFYHNPPRPLQDLNQIAFPDRASRVFGYYKRGWHVALDTVETSRGCTMDCDFCSITSMYGKNYRTYSIERVIEDIKIVKKNGGKEIFFVDDNITLNPKRFEELCQAIIDNGLNDINYHIQASTAGISSSERLVEKMKEANFTWVFLGIESIQENNLKEMGKGNILDKSIKAVEYLKKYDILIIGGFIVGLPGDKKEDIENIFKFINKYQMEIPYVQCISPYPKTRMRERLIQQGLVTNKNDFSRYDGFHVNVRTKHLTSKQIERIMKWGYFKYLFNNFVLLKHKLVNPFSPNFTLKSFSYLISSVILFYLVLTYKGDKTIRCRL